MNNTIRIIISGGIATVIQRAIELNPISLIGFGVFIVIFAVVSGIITYFFPYKKNKEESKPQITYIDKILKTINIVKILSIVTIMYLILNTIVNYTSIKLGFLDGNFKYKKVHHAVVITITQKPILSYRAINGTNIYQSLFKYHNKKYYLLKTIGIPKIGDKIITRFGKFDFVKFYKKYYNRDDIEDIIKNISNVGFVQIDNIEMPFKTYWYVNDYTNVISFGDDIRKYYLKKHKTDKIKLEQQRKIDFNNRIKRLTTQQLANEIKRAYLKDAFINNTRDAIKLFDEFGSRPKAKRKLVKDIDVYDYQFKLMSYLNLFKKKEQLNDILKKYNFGVVYSLLFPNMKHPQDIPQQQYSHIRLVDMKQKKKYILTPFTVAIKREYNMYGGIVPKLHIETKDDKVIIYLSGDEIIILDDISKKDASKIVKLLTDMIDSVRFIEKQFYGANNDPNFNYTNSNYLEIYDNDICELSYKYKNHNWYLQKKRLTNQCGKYNDIQKYLSGKFKMNIYDDLAQKKPINYMYFKPKLNLIYSAIDIDEDKFDENKDLIRLSKDKDIVFVYELKGKEEYNKYAQMPQYTKLTIKNKSPLVFKAMSYLTVKKSNDKYYIYLIKEDVFNGGVSNQIYYMNKGDYFEQ
jgi:hypothetical protein